MAFGRPRQPNDPSIMAGDDESCLDRPGPGPDRRGPRVRLPAARRHASCAGPSPSAARHPRPPHYGYRTGQQLRDVDDFECVLGFAGALFRATASPSMTRQYGQEVEMVSGSSARASSIRSVLIRVPIRSSIHIRAPPAPQQNPRSLHRCISVGLHAGHRVQDLPRRGVHLVMPAQEARVVVGQLLLHRGRPG